MAAKAFRSSMRLLPPFSWEGAGGIKGWTFSQNSSLTFHGFVRAIPRVVFSVALTASLLGFYRTIYTGFRIRNKPVSRLLGHAKPDKPHGRRDDEKRRPHAPAPGCGG